MIRYSNQTPDIKWTFRLKNRNIHEGCLFHQGILYVLSRKLTDKLNKKDTYYLFALDCRTGQIKWKFKYPRNHNSGYSASSLISKDNTIKFSTRKKAYVLDVKTGRIIRRPSYPKNYLKMCITAETTVTDDLILHYGKDSRSIYAFSSESGSFKWESSLRVQDELEWCLGSPSNDIIYAHSVSHPKGSEVTRKCVWALNSKNGKKKWKFEIEEYDPLAFGEIFCSGDMLFFGSTTELYMLDSDTGENKWSYLLYTGGPPRALPIPIVKEGKMYILYSPSWYEKGEFLCALSVKTGKEIWKRKADSVWNQPVVAGDIVYFPVESEKSLIAVDSKTGRTKWKFRVEDSDISPHHDIYFYFEFLPTLDKYSIYFACDKNIYVLDRLKGYLKYRLKLNLKSQDRIKCSPVVGEEKIYCLVETTRGSRDYVLAMEVP